MSRPHGSRNTKPSKAAIRNYYRLLKTRAEQGDTTAAGWLCQLDLLHQQKESAHE